MTAYARVLLWILRPALELHREQQRRAEIIALAQAHQHLRVLKDADLSKVGHGVKP